MDTIKTNEIKIVSNPRIDFGNLEELKNSIKKIGIVTPLIINSKNELLSGERRLRAAQELGLETVPVKVEEKWNEEKQECWKLMENIQRKDLTVSEEAFAFKKHLETFKKSTITSLAGLLGKTKDYVERRIAVTKLSTKCMVALDKRQIEVGHALLLGQMTKKQQDEMLEVIEENDLTVQNFSDQIRWMKKIDFCEIKFRPADESQKTIMEAIGEEQAPKYEIEDNSFKSSDAFKKELAKYVEGEREKLKVKGIKVFASIDDLKAKHPDSAHVQHYADEYQKAVEKLPNSKTHGVVVDIDAWGDIEKSVYRLVLKKEVTKLEAPKEKDAKAAAEILDKSRGEQLQTKIVNYRRDIQLEFSQKKIGNSGVAIRIILHKLLGDWGDYVDEAKEILGVDNVYDEDFMKKLLAVDDKKVNKALIEISKREMPSLEVDHLDTITKEIGFKYETDFQMTPEFLNLHRKDDLVELAKELKIDTKKAETPLNKKDDYVAYIIANWDGKTIPKRIKT